ncbi:hypothetical protein JW710_02205 [Candidatus Dojkabacteria bacterium]|nr:hypothetical protein [Candidatus Dojkabacteria bacterium]
MAEKKTEKKVEVSSPVDSSTTTTPEAPAKKSSKGLLIVLVIILVLVILGLTCSLICVVSGFGSDIIDQITEESTDEEDDDEEESEINEDEDTNDDDEEEESTPARSTFSGSVVSGTYASGWQIKEYLDGAGSSMLVSGVTYQGLTGLEIYTPSNKLVFKMSAVSGIGGTDACEKLHTFSDTSASYISDVQTRSLASGVTTTVVDLSASTYSQFNLFDLKARRIGSDLYYDKTSASSFDTACGIDYQFWWFNNLKFKADGSDTSGYDVEIMNSPTPSEFTELENILGSLSV